MDPFVHLAVFRKLLFGAVLRHPVRQITMISWELCKHLVSDVTVADALAPSLLNQVSLCNPGITAIELKRVKLRSIAN